jgi:hypothetical protein
MNAKFMEVKNYEFSPAVHVGGFRPAEHGV